MRGSNGVRAAERPVALITGGSSGIGLELARCLAREGHRLALLARRAEPLEQAAAELAAAGAEVLTLRADVADVAAVEAAFEHAASELGRLDLVVHSAALLEAGPFPQLEPDSFERLMRVNYLGSVNVARAAIPRLEASGGGRLALIASVIAFRSFAGFGAYAPTKAALVSLHQTLSEELRGSRVRLSIVYPPITETPMVTRLPLELRPAVFDAFAWTPAERVAARIARGLADGQQRIFGRWLDWCYYHADRLAPGLVGWGLRLQLARKRRSRGQAADG